MSAMRNRVTIDDLSAMESTQIAALSVEELDMLSGEIKEADDNLKVIKEKFSQGLAERYAGRSMAKRSDENKDYGTVRLHDGDFVIIADVGKGVEWSQKKLGEVWEQLREFEENPAEYIKVKYDVSESAFKNWPSKLQDMFMPARTTKPKKETFKIERKAQ